MSKHTPGPWKITIGGEEKQFGDLEKNCIPGATRKIASIIFRDREEFNKANARLIASAPELLENCKSAVKAIEHLERLVNRKYPYDFLLRGMKEIIQKVEYK